MADVSVYVVVANENMTSPEVNDEFVALWRRKPLALLALSTQVRASVGGFALRTDGVATRSEGASGGPIVSVTVFEGGEFAVTLYANT